MKFSKIQLGTVQFGLNYGIANDSGKPSYESSRDIVKTAYENGINCFDTAAAYGDSEVVLGRALDELNLQDKVYIISKVPPVSTRNFSHREAENFINSSVENSLRRLNRNHLDVCLFHREEDFVYMDILNKLESRGLIHGSGVSIDSAKYCKEILKLSVKFIQLPYNIIDKRFDEFMIKAEKLGIEMFTRSLYLQGLLLMPEEKIKAFLRDVVPVRRKLEEIASESDMTMPELCARFVLTNPAVTSILTGVDNLKQLEENIKLLAKPPLPNHVYQKIKETVPVFHEGIIRPTTWPKE